MNINECCCRPHGWPRPWWWSVYPRDTPTSPFLHERRGFACMQRTIVRNIPWSLRDQVMQQIWMYYKEKLTKNLADLNTFETSMSLRDRVTTSIEPYSLCLITYVHTALKWLRGAKILQHTPVENHNDISGKHSTVLKGPSLCL